MPKISIIIPTLNEERYIQNCLESILSSNYDRKEMEIFIVDGVSKDSTVEIVQKFQKKYSFIRLLENPKQIVPISMNLAIREAKGDYIIRLDAHATYSKNYFSSLVLWHEKLEADNVGTPIVTKVKNKTLKANSIKEVLSHKFGVGNSDFRIGVTVVTEVDTVPFGCYKKEVFEKYGYYDERLVRNQDIELNKRIVNGGGKIYLVPDVSCTYFAREHFTDLAKNNYANGFWNILTAYYTKSFKSLGLRHFIPLFFVLSLLLPLLCSLFFKPAFMLTLVSSLSYLSLVIIISLKLKNSTNSIGYLILSFLTLHLSYGWGSLMGVFSVVKKYIKGDK